MKNHCSSLIKDKSKRFTSNYNSKTMNHEDDTGKDDRKIIEVAMNFKRKDEIRNRKRILREKIKVRKMIETELGRKTNQQKKLLKHLNVSPVTPECV